MRLKVTRVEIIDVFWDRADEDVTDDDIAEFHDSMMDNILDSQDTEHHDEKFEYTPKEIVDLKVERYE